MAVLPLILGLCLAPEAHLSPAAEALAEAHARYERRADGARGPVASRVPIEGAIAAYRRAAALDPGSIEARVGLIRALFFRGGFTDADPEAERRTFAEAKEVAVGAVLDLETSLGRPRGAARLAALGKVKDAAALYLWSSIAWGQWAISTSKLSAARSGAAGKIRDLAQTSIALDPTLEQGSAYLILGRLHDQSPRIPFLTFFISRKAALRNLELALSSSPRNTAAQYFLAEAILHHAPERETEARRLLAACASATPRPELRVEDAHYSELARLRLAELDAP